MIRKRAIGYLVVTVVLVWVMFNYGHARFEDANCSGADFDGECDLAGPAGLLWGLGTFVVCSLAALLFELWLSRRQRAASASADATR